MKIENRDPRLEKDEDDFEEDNTEHLPRRKKQKLKNTKVDQATSKKELNRTKDEFLVAPGHHIDDCSRDALSLCSRYPGLAVPEEFVEIQANWVYTFPANISTMLPNSLSDQNPMVG